MKVDERALEAAVDITWPAQEWNGERAACEAVTKAAITAYLASLPGAGAGDHIGDVNKMVAPAGWKLVPVEPNDEMIRYAFGVREWIEADVNTVATWRAMLAAAPASPAPASLPSEEGQPVTVRYTNWRGETANRTILPKRIFWGSNEWHPEPQWLIEAVDIEKAADRTFALAGLALLSPEGKA